MSRRPKWFAAGVLLYAAASFLGCGENALPPSNAPSVIAIVGARLIDGSGAEPVEDSVLVIEGTRIQAAGSRAHTPVPKGGEVVDGAGKTIIPGLVEMHAHYFGDRARLEKEFKAQLYFGVTTSRSIGVDAEENLAIIAELRAGKIAGPRLYTAGLGFTHPQGHPVAQASVLRPATEEEAQQSVADLSAQKVDFVKMWVDTLGGTVPKISEPIRAAIVEEAQRRGIPVVAHISDREDVRQLAALGVKDFLHTVTGAAVGSDLIQMCVDQGVSFTPTLSIAQAGWYFAGNPQALQDPEIRAAFDPSALADLDDPDHREKTLSAENLAAQKARFEGDLRFVKTMSDAGVRIAAGSDSGTPLVPTGWGTHQEMQLLVEAGLSPMQALVAATRHGAELATGDKNEYGTLEPGKVADLIMLEADPLADIKNTRRIERVMQAGKWLERGALLAP